MKKIIIILAVLLACTSAFAVPAWRGLIRYTQPDGSTIMLRKHGDEFFHWTTNASGQVVEQDADGFWKPVSSAALESRRHAAMAKRQARNHMRKAGSHIATGQKHFLVILVEFQDVSFKSATAHDDFSNLLNQQGYSVNGGTGSARDFYYDNSHGSFEPIFDVYGPVKLENKMADYGGNKSNGDDKNPEGAVAEGCTALADQIDFSLYDNDNDGYVDLVFMYYAGYGEADGGSEDTIWPHQYELSYSGKSITLGGKKIDSYACTNELEYYGNKMCGIGTACHEFGHAMGLPDFYDTDYSTNGIAAAMFSFSLMDSGGYNNDGRTPPFFTVEERILLGWLPESTIKEFPSAGGNMVLTSVDDNVAYKTPTDKDGEYFVYECRGSNGWDAGLPAHGLTVTHIDKSNRTVKYNGGSTTAYNLWNNWQTTNSINENGSHPCCYIIPAADQSNLMFGYKYYSQYQDYYYDESNDPKIPFPGSSKVTEYTPVSWNGVESSISLSGISYANNTVSFRVNVPKETLDYPVIANPGNGSYQSGALFDLELTLPEDYDASQISSVSWYFDDEPVPDGLNLGGGTVILRSGIHTVEAALTLNTGDILTLTLEISAQ